MRSEIHFRVGRQDSLLTNQLHLFLNPGQLGIQERQLVAGFAPLLQTLLKISLWL